MEYIKAWRSGASDNFRLFGSLWEQDRSISIAYGVVAGALLWTVRGDAASQNLISVLASICGTQEVQPLQKAITLLQGLQPLAGAQALSREARNDEVLRNQLNKLLEFFRDDWLRYQLLKPVAPSVNISGSIEGANVVIGGVQYVAGDLVISQTLVQQKVRACPTAPSSPTHFAGRRVEIDQLKNVLSQGRNVAISSIQGMGGIGKTALALQLAAEMKEFGMVLWASLGPEPTVVNYLLNWARHADPDFEVGENPLDLLASRVQAILTDLAREHCPGRVLVILDDVWEGNSVAAARMLQRAAPLDAVHLITTRSHLVAAQLRSIRLELKPMSPNDSIQMLRNLLSSYPAISDEVLLDLAEVLGNHPLAMELAAGQVTLLERPESEINDLISQYRGGIPSGSPFRDINLELGEAREDNLELVLSFSYASLDEADRTRFRALGILAYAAPFDQPLCRAIWETEPKPSLDVLRHRALLTTADSPGWYQQHPLLRAYARALLNHSQPHRLQVGESYADYIVSVTEQFNVLPPNSWNHLEPYVPHVEEVGSSLVVGTQTEMQSQKPYEKNLRRALSFALNTSSLLTNRREINHADWLEMGLAISKKRMDLRYEVFFLNEISNNNYFRGDMQKAIKGWHEAQKIAEAAGDKPSLAQTYTNLALFFLSSDPMEAPRYLYPAIEMYEELENRIGLVNSLMHLADWHASSLHPYQEREKGVAVLQRALTTAQAAEYEQGKAEAKLKLGRLYDTLGNRGEAVELLSEAVEEAQKLGRRDMEGTAHLFLASALATLKRFDEAHTHLESVRPLVKTTGDRAGQAVALRNLGELYAYQGQLEQALQSFAEALPLVRKQTMRFLDEDADEVSIASCFFSVQLEDVVKLELVEQFRANASKYLQKNLETESEPEAEESLGFMPDDLLRLLLTETIRVNTVSLESSPDWSSALQGFIRRLTDHVEQYPAEVQFASALLDLTLDKSPIIPEENFYTPYLQLVADRIALKKNFSHNAILSAQEVEQLINNTLAVRIYQPESLREWSIQLRKLRRNAFQCGDADERNFYAAHLAVLGNRLISLSNENCYHLSFKALLDKLAQYEILPLDFILENTVAVKTVVPDKSSNWLDYLRQARLNAVRWGEENEQAFFEALINLIEGKPASLTDDSPYQPYLKQAQEAIASGRPLIVPLPPVILSSIMRETIAAKTTAPKTVDVLTWNFIDDINQATERGRVQDVALYEALLDLISGQPPALPDSNIYQPVLYRILKEISGGDLQPSKDMTIPQTQIDSLVRSVVGAVTDRAEILTQVREHLQMYRRLLDKRTADWENERAFVDALIARLEGRYKQLSVANPYHLPLENAHKEIGRYKDIHSKGGKIQPHRLDALLQETAAQSPQSVMAFMDGKMKDASSIAALFQDNHLSDMVKGQNQWKESLLEMRKNMAAESGDWRQEIELINALIAVVDHQPVSLSVESPYYADFQKMLEDIEYTHGISDTLQVRALASSKEEFQEHFTGLLSGKTDFLERLDLILMSTVIAKTIIPDKLQGLKSSLEKTYQTLAQQAEKLNLESTNSEMELIRALQDVLCGETPALPNTHPYHLHLRQVIESILVFNGRSDSPYNLPGDQIAHLYFMTSGVMTIVAEHFATWKGTLTQLREDLIEQGSQWQNAIAFIDALLIVLEGRPSDLPLGNPYRAFLHLTQLQIKQMQ